jgi:ribonucleotide reductase alpha subunit
VGLEHTAEALQQNLSVPVKNAKRENTAAWELMNVRIVQEGHIRLQYVLLILPPVRDVMLAPTTRTQEPLFAYNVKMVNIQGKKGQLAITHVIFVQQVNICL